jgi:TolB-like protein/Tfp pilus assembly protein PilF
MPSVFKPRFSRLYGAVALGLLATLVALLGIGISQGSKVAVADHKVRSVAVLPFFVVNGAGANDHEGMGLTDVLITRLSSINDLKVRPISTTLRFAGKDPVESGRQLAVDAVLDGTVYRQNDSLRVTARLIRLSDETLLWAGQFERTSQEELRLHNEIAEQVGSILAANLSSSERAALAKSYTESTDAWHIYSKGRVEWNKRTWASMLEAQRLFRNAIAIDPGFALAYSGLADTLATGAGVDEAHVLVDKALELDPMLAEAHASQGFIRMFHSWDWDGAEASFKRSIELNSNYATAHHWYATLLAVKGRNDEAKKEMQRALEINPLSPNFLADLGQIYYFNKEYEQAREYCLKALELDPEFIFAHEYLHDIYLMTAEFDKAVESELAAQRINAALQGNTTKRDQQMADERQQQRRLFYEKGIAAFEQGLADKAAASPWGYLAATRFAFLGNTEQTIKHLERSLKGREFLTPYLSVDPVFESARSDPRYRDLVMRTSLY